MLLSGATGSPVLATCTCGPGNAIYTLAGTDANIASSDNITYIFTVSTPDPYVYWRTAGGDDAGSQSLSCFIDYCVSTSEKSALVWGSSTPACATISSLTYLDDGSITAVLERPDRFSTKLSVSGDVAIEINRDCPNPSLTCFAAWGGWDLAGNCYTPFFSPESTAFTASAPGAALHYANFDAVSMPKSNLKGTGLSNASFAGANLREVNLDDAVMVYTDFTDADLTGAHAYGAFVYKATAPNGEEVNSVDELLNNGAPTTTTTTPGLSNNHFSFFTLTSETPKTFAIPFVNSILNDPSEFHTFIFLTLGGGTVQMTVEPESPVDLFYGIAGFLGLTPIAAYSAYGEAIETFLLAPDIGFGIVFLATVPATALIGENYPVSMNVAMSLTPF